MNDIDPRTLAFRIALTLDGLCRTVAARIKGGAMQAAMILLVWGRIKRIEGRIQRLLARFQAGLLRERVVTAGRPGGGGGRLGGGSSGMPRRFGWLITMVPYEAACFGSQLQVLLAEPQMRALLQASAQARRVLKPLCRMLAIEASVLESAAVAGTGLDGGGGTVSAPVCGAGSVSEPVKRRRRTRSEVPLRGACDPPGAG